MSEKKAKKNRKELRLEALKTIRRLRELRKTDTADLTEEQADEACKLMDKIREISTDINIQQIEGASEERDYWADLTISGHPPAGDNDFSDEHRSGGNGYEIRLAHQSKDYRSLFGAEPRNQYTWEDRGTTFFQALFSGRYHPGLEKRMIEGISSEGGFLVPSETASEIHAVSLENEIVMPRSNVVPMLTNTKSFPGLKIGDHSSNLFGGFTASYVAETGTITEADPKARSVNVNLRKLIGMLRFSNELLADLPNGGKQIINICGKGLGWYRDKFFLKGNGAGQPLGILNSNCLVTVAKETGQAADTITYMNLCDMMSSMYAGSFGNSVWIAHQTTIPQLLTLTLDVGTAGTHIPVMKESDGKFSILTRPVIFTEKTEVLGDKGDIILADFSQYLIGLKEEMRIDLSGHFYFTTDETLARLIERHDGLPLWDTTLTLEDGSTEVSPFVTLAERT